MAGVLLAAGSGSRLGRPKALVEVDGVRLVDRGIWLLQSGGASPLVVVTGAAPVSLPPGVISVFNPGLGQRHGILAGRRAGRGPGRQRRGGDRPGGPAPGRARPRWTG